MSGSIPLHPIEGQSCPYTHGGVIMFDSGIFHKLLGIAYFGYRQARMTNWTFRFRRKHVLCTLIENYLAWCVGKHKDNFATYGVPIRYNNNDHDAYKMMYFWFADDWMYIGTFIDIQDDSGFEFMDGHGVKWGREQVKEEKEDDLYLCQRCERLGVKNICYDVNCHHYNDPANIKCRRDFTPLSMD